MLHFYSNTVCWTDSIISFHLMYLKSSQSLFLAVAINFHTLVTPDASSVVQNSTFSEASSLLKTSDWALLVQLTLLLHPLRIRLLVPWRRRIHWYRRLHTSLNFQIFDTFTLLFKPAKFQAQDFNWRYQVAKRDPDSVFLKRAHWMVKGNLY